MMKRFRADLHVHTCLSPCADWDMSPRKITEACRSRGIHLIAICDHNSAENAAAVREAGERVGVHVLPGMEVCSREEVHLLCIFQDLTQARALQDLVQAHLPGVNKPEVLGYQVLATADDEVQGESDRLLMGATALGLTAIAAETAALGGLCIASHVDRPAFGIIGQLGFIPPDLSLDAVEISRHITVDAARKAFPAITGFPVIQSSDAHFLENLGTAGVTFVMEAPTLFEVRQALRGENGRGMDV